MADPAGERQGVRLQVAEDRGASKHFDDSRNRGIAGLPMRLSPRNTVDQTTMRTFGENEGSANYQSDTCIVLATALGQSVSQQL